MSKFATPVSMTGTKEEIESLIPGLEKMGYTSYGGMSYDRINNIIVTNFAGHNDKLGFTTSYFNGQQYPDRYYIPHFNKDLFLALAAMTEGTRNGYGEWLKSLNNGHIYRSSGSFNNASRKLSKEELIAKFGIVIHEAPAMTNGSYVVDYEFVMPEKWAIKRDNINAEVINKWANENIIPEYYPGYPVINGSESFRGFSNFLHSEPLKGQKMHIHNHVREGFTEITFEQFKKYILKEQPEMEKKIIGYKSPIDLFTGGTKVPAGSLFTETHYSPNHYGNGLDVRTTAYSRHIPKEIVETWEPVYEEPKPEFKEGDWIYVLNPRSTTGCKLKIGEVTQVTRVGISFLGTTIGSSNGGDIYPEYVRFATPQEIEEAQTIIVSVGGQFDVKIKENQVFHNSSNITAFVKGICERLWAGDTGGFRYDISDVTFSKTGCQNKTTKLSDWKEIYDLIKGK